MIILFCANSSTRDQSVSLQQVTMEMAFTFWEEGCDWSVICIRCDIGTWRQYCTKVGSQLVRVKNRIHISQQIFCAGNVHACRHMLVYCSN